MAAARVEHAVAVLDGKLYAAGGLGAGYSALSSVERYDPALDVWEAVAPMAEARMAHAVAVLDGKLYAVSGLNHGALSSLERYDPVTNALGGGCAVDDGTIFSGHRRVVGFSGEWNVDISVFLSKSI